MMEVNGLMILKISETPYQTPPPVRMLFEVKETNGLF